MVMALANEEKVRVRMLVPQFLSEFHREFGGRIEAGMILDVTPETARRWVNDIEIAEYAPDERTTREARKAELQAELERLAALEAELDDDDGHVSQPVMRRGRPTRADEGAE